MLSTTIYRSIASTRHSLFFSHRAWKSFLFRWGTGEPEIFTTDALDPVSARDFFIAWSANDKWLECRIAVAELQQASKRLDIEAAGFDFDGPLSPTPSENRIDFNRLLAPIRHLVRMYLAVN